MLGGGELTRHDAVKRRLNGPFDLVICADSGLHHAAPLGLTPTHVIGDFDSVKPGWEALAADAAVVRHSADQDSTDLQLAAELAIHEAVGELVIVGATGGRLDHLLGNVLLLPDLAARGISARLLDGWNEAWIAPPVTRFWAADGQIVSLIPLTPTVTGVDVHGLQYSLTGATLRWGDTVSVSNAGLGQEAEVSHRDGTLLIVMALPDSDVEVPR